jgi:subtilisin family serine protease
MVNNLKHSVLAAAVTGICLTSFGQTSTKEPVPNGWHLKDRQTTGYYGISLDKAYGFVKGKKSQTVIVAVIDSGIDTTHEDLRPILWTNPKEIPGNGIDDDRNGYVDDVHGWNFIGGRDGRNVKEDSYEAARVYHMYKARFETVTDPSTLSKEDQELYKTWKRAEQDISGDPSELMTLMLIKNAYKAALSADSTLRKELGKEEYTGTEVENFTATTDAGKTARKKFLALYQGLGLDMSATNKSTISEIGEYVGGQERKAEAKDKAPKNFRGEIVKDNEADINDRFYGNNDIMAGTPFHGTHVSGIIAGVRNNGKGIDGIADNVRIMMIRAVPDGDEHDKDIALAIRYAVDNGARVVNMSFGKGFSPQKQWVDDAVKYAESKGVLLVHAAGNDAADIDTSFNFPTPVFKNGGRAANWMTIGASGDPKNGGLSASFSNYGKKEVDVFAPGVNIYSSVPGGNTYGNASGTSMASPVTAGVAAFLLEYFPKLTAQQLKTVLEKSAVPTTIKTPKPGADGEEVNLSELSKTGGLINAYEAAKLAASMTAAKTPTPVKTKIKVKNTKKS